MSDWKPFAPADTFGWDRLVASAQDANPFQSSAWAEFKHPAGWQSERWLATDDAGLPVAAVQVLLKRLPLGRELGWSPGGPLTGFTRSSAEDAPELLRAWLAAFRARGGAYARFRLHRPRDPAWTEGVSRVLSRPTSPITCGVTLHIDLGKAAEEVQRGVSSKHRYYVKRAEKAGLSWSSGHDPRLAAEMALLYEGMAAAKGLGGRLFDAATLPRMVELFGDKALVLVGRLKGEPVTGCLAIQSGSTAFYQLAATSHEGRQVGAAYAMVPKLLELLQARGVTLFDFGGIDPASEKARGVDHFKKGFGGRRVEYVGEWDWAPWEWLRRAANVAMKAKVG